MRSEPGERLRNALLKAAGFPVLMGVLIFVGALIGNPDHSLRTTVTVFVFSCGWAALSSVPFLFFAWLRWRASKSLEALDEFDQRVKQRVRHSNIGRG